MNIRQYRKPTALLLFSLIPFVSLMAQTYDGSPYTGWANDYSGTEDHTLSLWKFDTATGVAANSYTGSTATLTIGSTSTQTGVAGKFGEALYVGPTQSTSSSGARSDGTDGVGRGMFNGSAMSVEFWYQPIAGSLGLGQQVYLFDKMYTANTGMVLTIVNGSANPLRFTVGNGSETASLTTNDLTWQLETWYHIAVTYENIEGDGQMKIFRDGAMLGALVVDDFGDLVQGIRYWSIGNRDGTTYRSGPGYYDNFRISNVAYNFAPIPEPLTISMALLLLCGVWLRKRFK